MGLRRMSSPIKPAPDIGKSLYLLKSGLIVLALLPFQLIATNKSIGSIIGDNGLQSHFT